MNQEIFHCSLHLKLTYKRIWQKLFLQLFDVPQRMWFVIFKFPLWVMISSSQSQLYKFSTLSPVLDCLIESQGM